MPGICKICNHPKRLEIDRQLVQGGSIAQIARFFAVGYDGLYRHQSHVTKKLSTAMEKKQTEEDFSLLQKIDQIIGRAEDIFLRNYTKGADVTALKALDSQRNTIELLARISASLHQAKIVELEILRLQSTENTIELTSDFQDNLAVLTVNELLLLNALADKLQRQDKTVDVVADFLHQQPLETILNTEIRTDHPEQGKTYLLQPAQRFVRTRNPQKPSPLETMQVREIYPTVIPG